MELRSRAKFLGRAISFCFPLALFSQKVCSSELNTQIHFLNQSALSYQAGQMGNPSMGLTNRSMTLLRFENESYFALSRRLLMGLNLDLAWLQQQSSLASTGGSNLAGYSYSLGPALYLQMSPKYFLESSFNFWGLYKFQYQTSRSQDDHLHSPLAFKLNFQRLFFEDSHWALGIFGSYFDWTKFKIAGQDTSTHTKQWALGLGISFRLQKSSRVSNNESPKELTSKSAPTEKIYEKISMEFDTFPYRVSELSDKLKNQLQVLSLLLKKNPEDKILIEGHADIIGSERRNKRISTERASHSKDFLVSLGISESRIQIHGLGSEHPVSESFSETGRRRNRRIEIFILRER